MVQERAIGKNKRKQGRKQYLSFLLNRKMTLGFLWIKTKPLFYGMISPRQESVRPDDSTCQ
jgi:hypothetical protein